MHRVDALNKLKLYEAMPIVGSKSQWLLNILNPLSHVCKIPAIPCEIRPIDSSGACDFNQIDGRIFLSKRIVFWSKSSVARIYLHECVHRLLEAERVEAHGVEFFTLLLVLHTRARSHFVNLGAESTPLSNLDFYDCADKSRIWQAFNIQPDDWWSAQVQWAIDNAPSLAESSFDAAELAKKIPAQWRENVKKLHLSINKETTEARALEAEMQRLKDRIANFKFALSLCVVAVLYVVGGLLMASAR
jgi:hypothetical protein